MNRCVSVSVMCRCWCHTLVNVLFVMNPIEVFLLYFGCCWSVRVCVCAVCCVMCMDVELLWVCVCMCMLLSVLKCVCLYVCLSACWLCMHECRLVCVCLFVRAFGLLVPVCVWLRVCVCACVFVWMCTGQCQSLLRNSGNSGMKYSLLLPMFRYPDPLGEL